MPHSSRIAFAACLAFCFWQFTGFAQSVQSLCFYENSVLLFCDSSRATPAQKVEQWQMRMWRQGFIESSFVIDTLGYNAMVHRGPRYKWLRLNVPDTLHLPAALAEKPNRWKRQTLNVEEAEAWLQELLHWCDNSGYPFASVGLGNLKFQDTVAEATLVLQKHRLIVFDTLGFAGEPAVSKAFIAHYLGIKPGKPYNEALVTVANQKLAELPFIKSNQHPVVYFKENKATVVLFLEKNKASSFDGIVGLAPASDLAPGKLLLTGEAHLWLQNLYSRGYSLQLDYRNFRGTSQDVFMQTSLPYLLGSPMGVDLSLQFLKFDSNYFNANTELGLKHQYAGNNYLKAFYRRETVNLLQLDTQAVLLSRSLPTFVDQRNHMYGLHLKQQALDYRLNPRRGYTMELTASTGLKYLADNAYLQGLGLFDSLKRTTLQYRLAGTGRWYMPIGKTSTLYTQVYAASVASAVVYGSELYRIGGLKTLRGYDEQSILARSFVLGTIEYRYLIDRNSHASLFVNGGWWQSGQGQTLKSGVPLGAGIGVSLQTKAGILQLYYALPFSPGKPFELRTGKVHFGVISYF